MKIGPREQVIISAVVVVVILGAIIGFLIWPQIRRIGDLDGQIASAQGDVASARALLQTREQSKARAADTNARWLRLANLVPDGPDLPSLIVELQDAAFDSGVQLLGVTPSAPVGAATYYSIPIKLDVVGTWADTVDYLQRLQKFNRGLRIVDSSSARVQNTDVANTENAVLPDYSVRTAIDIEAYMIPASSSSTSTPAPSAAPTATGQ